MPTNFRRTSDPNEIKAIATHPSIYKELFDDYAPPASEWEPEDDPRLGYILVLEDGETIGMIIVAAHSPFLYELHVGFLPGVRGRRAIEAGRSFVRWIWRYFECVRMFGNIVRSNRSSLWFARACGMHEFALQPKCFLKDGILQDLVMVAIDRPGGAPSQV